MGLEVPSCEGLKIISAVFYGYHAMKFRAHEFSLPNPVPGTGDSVPYHATQDVTLIDTDISCNIFAGAFMASALVSGLLALAPVSKSYTGCANDTLLVVPGAPGSAVFSDPA